MSDGMAFSLDCRFDIQCFDVIKPKTDKIIFVMYLRNQLDTFLMTKANLLPEHTLIKKQFLVKRA